MPMPFKLLAGLAALTLPALLWAQLPADPIEGGLAWTDPVPAFYQIRAEAGALCVARSGGGLATQLPHLILQTCAPDAFDQQIELVPNGTTAERLPLAGPVTWRIMVRQHCLTAARGVIFGAPAVDELDCGSRPEHAGRPSHMGAADQTWRLRRHGGAGMYEVRSLDGRCWSAQGGELREGVQLVMEPCDGRIGQRFEIITIKSDVQTQPNMTAAEEFGWLRLLRPLGFELTRFRSLRHINLPGGDYTAGMATANDEGLACAQACAQDQQCKGYTWADPRVRGGTPMCYLKNMLDDPVADNFTNSGVLRP